MKTGGCARGEVRWIDEFDGRWREEWPTIFLGDVARCAGLVEEECLWCKEVLLFGEWKRPGDCSGTLAITFPPLGGTIELDVTPVVLVAWENPGDVEVTVSPLPLNEIYVEMGHRNIMMSLTGIVTWGHRIVIISVSIFEKANLNVAVTAIDFTCGLRRQRVRRRRVSGSVYWRST